MISIWFLIVAAVFLFANVGVNAGKYTRNITEQSLHLENLGSVAVTGSLPADEGTRGSGSALNGDHNGTGSRRRNGSDRSKDNLPVPSVPSLVPNDASSSDAAVQYLHVALYRVSGWY